MTNSYVLVTELHHWVGWLSLIAGLVLGAVAFYISIIRHGDATPWFRRGVYAVFGLIVVQTALGVILYAMGGRPFQEVHLIYGFGALLTLPFFYFVERTSKKRPAMGSYIWGGFLLAAIALRAIMTSRG